MTLTIPRAPAVMPPTVRVPCRPALDSEAPSAALRMRTRALAAGWAVMLTYAAGVEVRGRYVPVNDPEHGKTKTLVRELADIESAALRAATLTSRRRFAVWERVTFPGGQPSGWSCVSGFGWSAVEPIHALARPKPRGWQPTDECPVWPTMTELEW